MTTENDELSDNGEILLCVVCRRRIVGSTFDPEKDMRSISFGPDAKTAMIHIIAGVCAEHHDTSGNIFRAAIYETVFQMREIDPQLKIVQGGKEIK